MAGDGARVTEFRRNTADLARKAYPAMAASFTPVPAHRVASFRLWHFPETGPQTSWVIFHGRAGDPDAGPPLVRRVQWDRDGDLERLRNGIRYRPLLEPTLSIAETEVDARVLEEFMSLASGLGLPRQQLKRPYLSEQRAEFGLEGFDLEALDGRPVVRLEWGIHPPLQLEAIVGWAGRVRAWIRRELP